VSLTAVVLRIASASASYAPNAGDPAQRWSDRPFSRIAHVVGSGFSNASTDSTGVARRWRQCAISTRAAICGRTCGMFGLGESRSARSMPAYPAAPRPEETVRCRCNDRSFTISAMTESANDGCGKLPGPVCREGWTHAPSGRHDIVAHAPCRQHWTLVTETLGTYQLYAPICRILWHCWRLVSCCRPWNRTTPARAECRHARTRTTEQEARMTT